MLRLNDNPLERFQKKIDGLIKKCTDNPSSLQYKRYFLQSFKIFLSMRRLKRDEVLAQLPFQKNQFPFLYSYTEELFSEQQSAFLNLRDRSGNEPKRYNEFREINKLRDRLNLLSFEI